MTSILPRFWNYRKVSFHSNSLLIKPKKSTRRHWQTTPYVFTSLRISNILIPRINYVWFRLFPMKQFINIHSLAKCVQPGKVIRKTTIKRDLKEQKKIFNDKVCPFFQCVNLWDQNSLCFRHSVTIKTYKCAEIPLFYWKFGSNECDQMCDRSEILVEFGDCETVDGGDVVVTDDMDDWTGLNAAGEADDWFVLEFMTVEAADG